MNLPSDLVDTWREKRTARHKQVSEVLRRAFRIDAATLKQIIPLLKDTYSFRDRAVHPIGTTTDPVQHPELRIYSEWRYVAYWYQNAYNLLRACHSLFSFVLETKPSKLDQPIEKYRDHLRPLLVPVLDRLQHEFIGDDESQHSVHE